MLLYANDAIILLRCSVGDGGSIFEVMRLNGITVLWWRFLGLVREWEMKLCLLRVANTKGVGRSIIII